MVERLRVGSDLVRQTAAAGVVAAVFVGVGAAALWLRADLTQGAGFLFGDEGQNLWLAARLSEGARLHADAFTPYGPLTAWTYAAVAAAFGNTPLVFRSLSLVLSAASLALLTATFARCLSFRWAVLWGLIVMTPLMLGLGPVLGGLTVSTYTGLERLFIAAAVVLWRPPSARADARSLLIGVLAGCCQWARFGPAAMVLAGIIVCDLLGERRARATSLVIAGGLAVEASLAAWAFATLPAAVAVDVLWPSYLLEAYTWMKLPRTGFSPGPWPVWLVHYGPALAGALVVLLALGFRGLRPPSNRAAMLLACAYAVGAAALFWTDHHFRQYAWMVGAAGGLASASVRWPWRAAALALSLPACVVIGRVILQEPAPTVRLVTPAAGAVELTRAEIERVEALAALRATLPGRMVVAPGGAGWHAAYREPSPTRQVWFMRGVVRPWERDRFLEAYRGVDAVAICPDAGGDLTQLRLPDVIVPEFAARFSVRARLADCIVLRNASETR